MWAKFVETEAGLVFFSAEFTRHVTTMNEAVWVFSRPRQYVDRGWLGLGELESIDHVCIYRESVHRPRHYNESDCQGL